MAVVDNNGYSAIDQAKTDQQQLLGLSAKNPCEAYTFGSNTSYVLGTNISTKVNMQITYFKTAQVFPMLENERFPTRRWNSSEKGVFSLPTLRCPSFIPLS